MIVVIGLVENIILEAYWARKVGNIFVSTIRKLLFVPATHRWVFKLMCCKMCVEGFLSTATGGHCTSVQPHVFLSSLRLSVTLSWISPFLIILSSCSSHTLTHWYYFLQITSKYKPAAKLKPTMPSAASTHNHTGHFSQVQWWRHWVVLVWWLTSCLEFHCDEYHCILSFYKPQDAPRWF